MPNSINRRGPAEILDPHLIFKSDKSTNPLKCERIEKRANVSTAIKEDTSQTDAPKRLRTSQQDDTLPEAEEDSEEDSGEDSEAEEDSIEADTKVATRISDRPRTRTKPIRTSQRETLIRLDKSLSKSPKMRIFNQAALTDGRPA